MTSRRTDWRNLFNIDIKLQKRKEEVKNQKRKNRQFIPKLIWLIITKEKKRKEKKRKEKKATVRSIFCNLSAKNLQLLGNRIETKTPLSAFCRAGASTTNQIKPNLSMSSVPAPESGDLWSKQHKNGGKKKRAIDRDALDQVRLLRSSKSRPFLVFFFSNLI